MNVQNRLQLIHVMCIKLEGTSSRNDKEAIVESYRKMDSQLSSDITYVFEILAGQHKLGYTFIKPLYSKAIETIEDIRMFEDISIEEYLKPLYSIEDKSDSTIRHYCSRYYSMYRYLAPILNRWWKIGINKSQLAKLITSPMLAKKYEPGKHCVDKKEEYYITEKLDGNRCVAIYNFSIDEWEFVSRSGKALNVKFDMQRMPKGLVYDGEILSKQQIFNPGQRNFNSLSGAVNSKYGDKSDLIYNIFDIIDDVTPYKDRRAVLNSIHNDRAGVTSDTRILPLLAVLNQQAMESIDKLLEMVENWGGEGLMINVGSRKYEHKRTDALLKVKSVYTMDMKVIDIEYGTGKYCDAVGAIHCQAVDGNKVYCCRVGSGLSDDQRFNWVNRPENIIGKIVEVAYFSVSQDKNASGTNTYSLRFPRFKRIRTDKTTTSVD